MSASPQPGQSTKRPLEETSSPSRNDQPDAKRPALDKVIKGDDEAKEEIITETNGGAAASLPSIPPAVVPESNGTAKTNGEKSESKDDQGDTIVPDAPEPKPIASTAGGPIPQTQANPPANAHDETAWIHIRAVISSPEAATIIGKGGENVTKIRMMSGAKCTVSDYQKGAVERILTVSGVVDAAAKVGRFPSNRTCSVSLDTNFPCRHLD
jgi:poly(rC)-binding protein 2/3/4